MTVSSTAESRPALTRLTMPPWLWVWLAGYLLAGMPAAISGMYSGVVPFLGHLNSPPQVTDPSLTVESFSSIFGVLIYAPLAAGAVTVLFPHLRGRWVEWRFKLTWDDRRIMTEMQQFVKDHDPSIQLRVSIRGDQMARIYPVGWRSARIAVFLPLTTLWKSDRKAAEAILLHEVAHRRQGDQLIMGLGSPFVWLIRIWAPAYLLFVFIPVMVYFVAGGDTFASFVAVSGGQDAVAIPAEIVLPVTALWLAELSADQLAAQEIGADALRRALQAGTGPCASPATRAVTLLSHPPRRLRLRRVAARPAGTVALMAAWPAGLVAWLLILPGAMGALTVLALGSPLSHVPGFSPGMPDVGLMASSVHALLVQDRSVVITTALLLLAWPTLAAPWERLWSSGPGPGRHQPWWPYLAAASLPVGMLLLSLAPLPRTSPQEIFQASLPARPQGACSQVTSWLLRGGLTEPSRAATEFSQLVQARGNKRVMAADAWRVDAAIRAALDNPPPGAARPSYVEVMTDFRTATQDMQTGNIVAAGNAMDDAKSSYTKAIALIVDDMKGHCNYRGLPAATPPG
jgi:Zn-dependent protease with chaperone function